MRWDGEGNSRVDFNSINKLFFPIRVHPIFKSAHPEIMDMGRQTRSLGGRVLPPAHILNGNWGQSVHFRKNDAPFWKIDSYSPFPPEVPLFQYCYQYFVT